MTPNRHRCCSPRLGVQYLGEERATNYELTIISPLQFGPEHIPILPTREMMISSPVDACSKQVDYASMIESRKPPLLATYAHHSSVEDTLSEHMFFVRVIMLHCNELHTQEGRLDTNLASISATCSKQHHNLLVLNDLPHWNLNLETTVDRTRTR